MKKYNALFSQESVALYQLFHTDPKKIDQHLANFPPYTIPVELSPYYLGISAFQKCARIMGNPMDVWFHAGNLLMIQLIVNIPLTFSSNGSPLELTCMHL